MIFCNVINLVKDKKQLPSFIFYEMKTIAFSFIRKSRFARNTVTVLKFARELKELGVGIFLKNRTLTLYQGTVR